MAPIDASDQAQIIRMMDEEDGVLQVRKKKGNKKQKPEILRPLLENESIALISQGWDRWNATQEPTKKSI